MRMMKLSKTLFAVSVALGLAAPFTSLGADAKDPKAKAYPLETCIVSDEKLGSMGDAYVFTHEGQEIKLCCKSCQKDFNKNPKKYLKKIEKTDKKK